MILYELTGSENNPVYQALAISNAARHYDFLRSIVAAAVSVQRPFLSAQILTALNFHAITCLHTHAGEYRPCAVTVDEYVPPDHYRVHALMDDLVNLVNRNWEGTDPVTLATFLLWRLNNIHPFINGNGRTARAASYFVLCIKSGGWLRGTVILPELILRERGRYVAALKHGDQTAKAGSVDLAPLHTLLSELLTEQLAPSPAEPGAPADPVT